VQNEFITPPSPVAKAIRSNLMFSPRMIAEGNARPYIGDGEELALQVCEGIRWTLATILGVTTDRERSI
jgi:hypothetical protein